MVEDDEQPVMAHDGILYLVREILQDLHRLEAVVLNQVALDRRFPR